eukprot:COSAG05_NODE_764_length_7477_cov_18.431553_3_plen_97_part_00
MLRPPLRQRLRGSRPDALLILCHTGAVQFIRDWKPCTTDIYLRNECARAHVGLSIHAPSTGMGIGTGRAAKNRMLWRRSVVVEDLGYDACGYNRPF